MRILAPSRCRSSWCRCCIDRTAGLWLPATPVLVLLFLATALDGSSGATSLGVSMRGPGILVSQGEKRGNTFYHVRRQFLEHLLITYSLTESNNDRCVRNMRNSTSYFGEARDECPERLFGFLPHGVEVSLHTMLLVRTARSSQ